MPRPSPVLLITGASRGIGQACAEALAAPGVTLALLARDARHLDETTCRCEERGATVHRFGADLADVASIAGLMARVRAVCGPLTGLVNNAGIWIERPFLDGPMDLWDAALDVNLKAVMHLTRHALEGMPEGGAIVFIASTASRRTYAGGTNYCAAKHGIMGFAGALFEDVRERGIKVGSVLPGVVATDMHADDPSLDPERMLHAEDVAAAVAYLLHSPAHVCPTEIVLQPQRYPKRGRPAVATAPTGDRRDKTQW